MNPQDQILLAHLPHYAFAFSVVLARVVGVVVVLPGLGDVAAPTMVRAALAGAAAILLVPGLMPLFPSDPSSVIGYAMMIISSFVAGFWLGWLARSITFAIGMAGQWISAVLGLSNILVPDDLTGGQEPALGRLLDLAVPALLLATGLYTLPLVALSDSFSVIRPGAVLPIDDGARMAVAACARCFSLAFQLCAPFIIVAIGWNIALGIMSRLVPRVHIYFLGLPGQILGGLGLLAVLIDTLLHVWLQATSRDFMDLVALI